MCRVVKDKNKNVLEVYAANGSPSILFNSLVEMGMTPNQAYDAYLQVHTTDFKVWFGDWVNDPTNASKVVDVNGEPKIVFHGTQDKFNEFDPLKTRYAKGTNGFWFSEEAEEAAVYMESARRAKEFNVIPAFLNVRDLTSEVADRDLGFSSTITQNDLLRYSDEYNIKDPTLNTAAREFMQGDGLVVEGNKSPTAIFRNKQYVVFNSNQAKHATENTGDYKTDNPNIYMQATPEMKEAMDEKLNAKVKNYLDTINVPVIPVEVLHDIKGNPIDGVAMADMLRNIVQVVEGRGRIDSLPEEAAHYFVELLKVGKKPLYNSMVNSIKKYAIYNKTLEDYSDNALYQNEDGTVNIGKITDEAIGKMIAREMVNQHLEDESQETLDRISRWFAKLWNYITGLFTHTNPYQSAAFEILNSEMKAYEEASRAPVQDPGIDPEVDDVTRVQSKEQYLQSEPTSEKGKKTLQEERVDKIMDLHDRIHKVPIKKAIMTDARFITTKLVGQMDDAPNVDLYEVTLENGTTRVYATRVSHHNTMALIEKQGLERAKEINTHEKAEHAALMGTKIHGAAQSIIEALVDRSAMGTVRFTHTQGVFTPQQIAETLGIDKGNKVQERAFKRLMNGMKATVDLIEETQVSINPNGKYVLMTEVQIGNIREDVAGTQDVVVIYSNGKQGIYDFKTMSPRYEYLSKGKSSTRQLIDNPHLVKMDGWTTQQGFYKLLNEQEHGIPKEDIIHTRIIPIHTEYQWNNKQKKWVDKIVAINMFFGNESDNEFLRQIAVAEEITSYPKINSIVGGLYAEQKKIRKLMSSPAHSKDYNKNKERLKRNEETIQRVVTRQDMVALAKTAGSRVMEVNSNIHITDPTDPRFMSRKDLENALEDLVLFRSIHTDAAEWISEKIAQDKEMGGQIKRMMEEGAIDVQNTIMMIKDRVNTELISIAEKEGDPIDKAYPEVDPGQGFSRMAQIPHPVFRLIYQKIYDSFDNTRDQTLEVINDVEKHKNAIVEVFGDGQNLLNAYDKLTNNQGNLIGMYSSEFHEEIDKRRMAEDVKWFKDNFKLKPNANQIHKRLKANRIEPPKRFTYNDEWKEGMPIEKKWIETDNSKDKRRKALVNYDNYFNLIKADPKATNKSWLNKKLIWILTEPKNPEAHYSEKYKELLKPENKPLMDYYKMVQKWNSLFNNLVGDRIDKNYILNARDGILEDVFNNGLQMGRFMDNLARTVLPFAAAEDMGVQDSSGNYVKTIPMPYTSAASLRNAKGEFDYTLKTRDLSKALVTLAQTVYNHANMTRVEGYVLSMKNYLQDEARQIPLTSEGKLSTGTLAPKVGEANPELIATLDKYINYYLYGQKLQDIAAQWKVGKSPITGRDVFISPAKVLQTLKTVYSMKALGFAVVPAIAARVAGQTAMMIETIDGENYNSLSLKEAQTEMVANYRRFELFVELTDPYQAGRFRQQVQDITARRSGRWFNLDRVFWFLRGADENMDSIVAVAMAKRHGIDKEGIVQRLSDMEEGAESIYSMYLKSYEKEDSLPKNFKSGTKAHKEFRQRVMEVAAKLKGRMSEQDIVAANTGWAGWGILHFRSWMPDVLHERYKTRTYNRILKTYEEGRMMGLFRGSGMASEMEMDRKLSDVMLSVLKRGVKGLQNLAFLKKFTTNPAERARLQKAGKWNEKDEAEYNRRMESLRIEWENWKDSVTDPRIKESTLEQYAAMRQRSVRRALMEIRAYLGLFAGIMVAGVKTGPDDERLYQKTWLSNKLILILNRARLEMGFSINPTELTQLLTNMFPLVGLFEDMIKIVENGFTESLELTGIKAENPHDNSPMFYHSSSYLLPGLNQMSKVLEIYEKDKGAARTN